MKTKIQTAFLMAALMGLIAVPALAGPNLPQHVNPADGCGQTLNHPGEYVLTGDLTCAAGQNGIIITASDVKFHLGGHTISNPSCDLSLEMIGVFVQGGTSGVLVEGGTVSGFNDGIVVSSLTSQVVGMTVKNACLYGILVSTSEYDLDNDNRVERNVVTSSGYGVALGYSKGNDVNANDLSGNAVGILVSANSNGNRITNNIVNNSTQTGAHIADGSNNLFKYNSFNFNANGIVLAHPGNSVLDNTVSGSANTGISIETTGTKSTVERNTVLGSGIIDMSDINVGCGVNAWMHNTFETDLVAGIPDFGPGAGCLQ